MADTKKDDDILDEEYQEQAIYELMQMMAEAVQMQDLNFLQLVVQIWESKYKADLNKFNSYYKQRLKKLLEYYEQIVKRLRENPMPQLEFLQAESVSDLEKIIESAKKHKDLEKLNSELKAWKAKHPQSQFNEIYKQKIESLTNRSKLLSITKAFNQRKAFIELEGIIDKAKDHKDLVLLEKDIDTWKGKFKVENFRKYYKTKIDSKLNENNLIAETGAFDQEETYREIYYVVDSARRNDHADYEDLQRKVNEFLDATPVENFKSSLQDDLEKITDENYLISITSSAEGISYDFDKSDTEGTPTNHSSFNPKKAILELDSAIVQGNTAVIDWIYENRRNMSKFDDTHIGMIMTKTSKNYQIPRNVKYLIPDSSENSLSYQEYKSIDETRKETAVEFFAILSTGRTLTTAEETSLQNIHKKSETARVVDMVWEKLDSDLQQEETLEKDEKGKSEEPENSDTLEDPFSFFDIFGKNY